MKAKTVSGKLLAATVATGGLAVLAQWIVVDVMFQGSVDLTQAWVITAAALASGLVVGVVFRPSVWGVFKLSVVASIVPGIWAAFAPCNSSCISIISPVFAVVPLAFLMFPGAFIGMYLGALFWQIPVLKDSTALPVGPPRLVGAGEVQLMGGSSKEDLDPRPTASRNVVVAVVLACTLIGIAIIGTLVWILAHLLTSSPA